MPISFPSNPTVGQIYTSGIYSWRWDGERWTPMLVQGASGATGLTGSTGATGPTGLGFSIAKTYASVAALTADTAPTGILAGQFAIIDNGNYGTDTENSRLYLWNGTAYQYVTDLSGAQGIQGPAGATGVSGTSANIIVYDEGNLVIGQVSSFNFVGMGISANNTGSNVTVTVTATGTGGGFYYANTSPATPVAGDRWVNSDTLREFVYVNDGDSSQWIETVKFQQQGATGATGPGANISAIAGNLVPAANVTYDLGTDNYRWRDLYLSGNTIYLGGTTISANAAVLNLPSGTKIGNVNVATTDDVAIIASGTSPKVANIQVATNTWTALDDTAVDTAGGYILVNGSGFVSVPQVYINNAPATTVSYVSGSQLRVQVPANAAGTYVMYVINPDGGTAILVPGISYSGFPAWASPAAGSVATNYEMDAITPVTLSASSNSAVTYVLASGSLPPGVSLSGSSLSGTTQSTATNTTYNFTIEARDAENQSTLRNFSITVNTDVVTWSTPSAGAVISGYEFAGVSQSLSATSAAGRSVTYSGSGLPANITVTGSTVAGNLGAATDATTASNTTATLTATANVTNRSAARTTYFVANPDQVTWTTLSNTSVISGYEFSNLNQTLSATSAAGRTITYSGASLPANVTITGATLGGLLGAVGNTSSTLTATAATTNRANTVAVTLQTIPDVVTWSAPASGQTITIQATDVVNQALAATSAAGKTITYSATNLPTGLSVVGAAVTGTPSGYTSSTTVSSNLTATAATTNRSSTISITWSINLGVIFTDAFFSNVSLLLNATSNASVISDASSNNFQLTPVGDVRASTFSPYLGGNYSVLFNNATPDNLIVTTDAGTSLTGDFTIESWIYMTATAGAYNAGIFSRGPTSSSNGYFFGVRYDSTPINLLTFHIGYGGSYDISSSSAIPLNQWVHVAASRSGTALKLFINGQVTGTVTTSTLPTMSGSDVTVIGRSSYDTDSRRYFPGYISNLRVVKNASLYTANFTPSTTALTNSVSAGTVSLLACQSPRFADNSGNNLSVTTYNTPRISQYNPFNLVNTGTQGSMYFDGTDDQVTTPTSAVFALTGTWTIECWFYVTTTNAARLWQMSDDKDNCELNSPSAGYVNYYNGGSSVNSGASVFASFSWNHLAAVCISNTTKVFVNGTLVITHTTSNSSSRYLAIGGNSNLDFLGYIADFRVVTNRAMYPTTYPEAALTTANNTVLLLNNSVTNAATNNTFLDSSANNFAITRNGNATQGSFSPFSNGGWSVYGSGSTSYAQLNNTDYAIGTGDFTIEFWMYLTSDKSTTCFCSSPSNPNLTVAMTNGSAGARLYYLEYGGTGTTFGAGSNYLNTWTHVAFVRSSGIVTCYQNGNPVNVGGTSKSAAVGSTANLYLLRNSGDTGQDLPGYISNFRICKSAVYTTSFTPSTTVLTTTSQGATNCVLLAFQNNRFRDNSTNNSTITPTSLIVTAFAPFAPAAYNPAIHGGSAYFDGSGDYLTTPSNSALSVGTGAFTYECFVYFQSLPAGVSGIAGQIAGSDTSGNHSINFYTNGSSVYISIQNNSAGVFTATTSVTIGQWYHLLLVRSSDGTTSAYVNGTRIATASNTTDIVKTSFVVGRVYTTDNAYYGNVYISNLRLVKGYAIYDPAQSTLSVPTAPVTAVYGTQLLLNATNAGIWDASGRNNFETVGDAKVVAGIGRYTNGSVYFDGTGDYLTAPTNSIYLFGTNDFTVELWYYPTALTGTPGANQALVGMWGSGNISWLFYLSSGNLYWYTSTNGSTQTATMNAASGMSAGNWYHLALCRSSGTTRIFVNGNSIVSTTTSVSLFSATCPLTIGFNPVGGTPDYLYGYISDLRITAGQALYTNTFSVPTRSLTSVDRTQLLTLQNNQPHNNHSFQDSSAYNHVITRSGNASQGTFSPFSPGGWSVFFDGNADYFTVPANVAFAYGTGAFTIEAWVYRVGLGPAIYYGSVILAQAASSNNYVLLSMSGDSNNQITFYLANSLVLTSTNLNFNQWYHIAVVRENTSTNGVKLYVNGALNVSGTSAANLTDTTLPVSIGDYSHSQIIGMNGYISNLRVVKGTAVYTGSFTPPTAPLTAIANTSLLVCHTNRFVDGSANAFTITRYNDTRVVAFAPFAPTASYTPALHGGSLYLDGSGDYLQFGNGETALDLNGDSSIELWFYPLATSMILTAKYSNVGSNQFYINADSSNKIYAEFLGSTYYAKTSTASYVLRSWNHLLVTKSGTTAKMWLNGVYDGAWTVSSTNSTTKAIAIGAATDNYGTTTSNGYISSLRYSRVATETGTSNIALPTAPLPLTANTVALFNFTADAIEDRSARSVVETVADARHSRAVTKFANASSMYFDGSGDYLRIPYNPNLWFGSSDWTIELWYYPTSFSTYNVIWEFGYGSPDTIRSIVIYSSLNTGAIRIAQSPDGTTNYDVATGGTAALNTWSHLAFIRNGANITTYINGVSQGTITAYSLYNSTTRSFYIGAQGDLQAVTMFNGYIQDLRVTKGRARYQPAAPTANLSVTASTVLLVPGNTANTVIRDSSVNNFQLTPFGDSRASNFTPYGTAWSAYFDGTGDYLGFGSNNPLPATGDFTFECWIYLTSLPGVQAAIIGNQNQSNRYMLWVTNTGSVSIQVGPSFSRGTGNNAVAANKWYHIATTRTGTTHNLFIDGIAPSLTTSGSSPATIDNTEFFIGINYNSTYAITGFISNFRVVSQVLYATNFIPATTPLTPIANTTLLTCHTNRFVDGSTNNFAFTRYGDTAIRSFNPFNITNTGTAGSMYFDGTDDYVTAGSNTNFQFGTGDFTVEWWQYISGYNGSGAKIWQYANDGNYFSGGTGSDMTSISTLNFTTAGGANVLSQTVQPYQWNHIAISRASGTTRIFVNGSQTNSLADSTNYNYAGTYAFSIGGGRNGAGTYVNSTTGYITNFKLVKGTAVYTANFTPATSSLTASTNTQLLTLQYRQPHNNHGFLDSSSNQFLITRNGNASQGTFSPFSPSGWSAYFNGSSNIVGPTDTALGFGSNDFTIEMWANIPSTSGYGYFASVWETVGGSDGNSSWLIRLNNNGTLITHIMQGAGTYNTLTSGQLPTNTWFHIAFTRSGNTQYLFINGSLAQSSAVSGAMNTAIRALRIGTQSGGNALTGYISNLRIINGTCLYASNFVLPTSALSNVPNTKLLTCQSNRVVDNSGNNFSLTPTSIQMTAFSPFTPAVYNPVVHGGSGYFDGTGDYINVGNQSGLHLGSGDYTVELWMWKNTNTAYMTACGDFLNSSTNTWQMIGDATGTKITWYNGASNDFTLTSVASIPIMAWTHVAFVRLGTTLTLYINGVSDSSASLSTNYNDTTTSFFVGHTPNLNASRYWNGYISGFRLVKGTALYTSNFTLPTASPTVNTNTQLLLNFTDAAVQDLDTINTLETVGDAREVNFGPLMSNYSVYFDGTGDYLTTPSNAAFAFGTGDFTVEAWVYVTGTNYCEVYTTASGSFPTTAMRLMITNAQKLQFYDGTNSATSTGSVLLNSWTHVALSRSGTSVRLFINGTQDGTTTSSNNLTQQIGYIGRTWDSFDFTGYISNLRIIKGIALYTVNFTPPTAPLTAVPGTSLLTCHANRFRDGSVNNFAITRTGDAKVSDFSPFGAQTANPPSIYFDGTGDYIKIPSTPALAFGTGDFTIEMWYYTETTSGWRGLYSSAASDNQANTMRLMLETTNTSVNLKVGSTFYTFTTTLLTAQWNHIALVRSNGVIAFYYNGQRNATTASDTTSIAANLVTIGANFTGGTELFTGYISDLRVTLGRALYGGFEPPTQPFATR